MKKFGIASVLAGITCGLKFEKIDDKQANNVFSVQSPEHVIITVNNYGEDGPSEVIVFPDPGLPGENDPEQPGEDDPEQPGEDDPEQPGEDDP